MIAVEEASRKNAADRSRRRRDATAHAACPKWLELDAESLKGKVLSHCRRARTSSFPIQEQLIVELYSK